MSYRDTDTPRDYGGWRRRRGIGMFGFGAAGTTAVLGVLLALIITATADAAVLVYRAAGPAGRRAVPGQDRRGAARRGRAAADPLAVRVGAELDPVPGCGGGRAFPPGSSCPGCWRR